MGTAGEKQTDHDNLVIVTEQVRTQSLAVAGLSAIVAQNAEKTAADISELKAGYAVIKDRSDGSRANIALVISLIAVLLSAAIAVIALIKLSHGQ